MALHRSIHWTIALFILGIAREAVAQPHLTVTPLQVNFNPPSIMLGRGSPELPIELKNTGTQPLQIQDIAIKGSQASDFSWSPCGRAVLDPDVACRLLVTFRPTAVGLRQSELVIVTNDPTSPSSVALTGNAIPAAPILEVSPPSLSFEPQLPGSSSSPQTVTLRNVGRANLNIASITSSGRPFLRTASCNGAVIAPGGTCAFEIRFNPSVNGAAIGRIRITSDNLNGPVNIALGGVGAAPSLSVSPSTLNFGTREIGATGNTRPIDVTNTGTAPLVITDARPVQGQARDFRVFSGVPCTAQPQGSCRLEVGFAPLASGTRLTELVVSSNSAPVRVPLQGFGVLVAPTSPPPFGEDDHSFLSTKATPVPAGCVGSPQQFRLDFQVTRAVGPILPNGTLAAWPAAVASGALSPVATLELMVFDAGTAGQHRLTLNNMSTATFPALGPGWKLRTLTVPISSVRFPARGAIGAGATNTVVFEPDIGNVGTCFAIAWARLFVLAVSPVILVHGNKSDGGFFVRQGFVGPLNTAGIANDASINLNGCCPGGSNTVSNNATTLDALIRPIVLSFGVDSVHIVAHSQGGLDARAWLGRYSGRNPPFVRVLSLTTLSTPHRGSALADLALTLSATALLNGLSYGDLVAMGLPAAYADLTTVATASFNPPLPPAADYRTIGADADRNGDLRILSVPIDEYAGSRIEDTSLTTPADPQVNAAYGFLRTTGAVAVKVSFVPVPCPLPCPVPVVPVRVTQPVPVPGGGPNDLLVTTRSAMPALPPFIAGAPAFAGPAGRDHASVGNAGVAAAIIPLLLTSDRTRGDLARTP